MNSRSLQNKFPEVYRQFFSKCPIVVSAPGNFFWSGEYAAMFGGLTIKQNVPLRSYIGLEASNTNKVESGQSIAFIPSKAKFASWIVPPGAARKVRTILQKFLLENHQKTGFIYHILLEVPSGCGLASSGAFAAAVALAAYLHCGLIDMPKIKKWSETKLSELTKDSQFNKVFRLAWKIESTYHNQSSSGAAPFAAITGSALPIVYFTEKRTGDLVSHPKARFPVNIADDYDLINEIDYRAYRLEELLELEGLKADSINLRGFSEWPIDFGLIYSGDTGLTEASIKSLGNIEDSLLESFSGWKKYFSKIKLKDAKPLFYEIIKQPKELALDPYLKSISVISMEILSGLVSVFTRGSSKVDLQHLFNSINCNQGFLKTLDVSSPLIDEICYSINKQVIELGDELGAGCKLTGAGKKGDILFAVNYHGLRDQIDNIIDKLCQETKENIWLDYASWIDGIEEEGARVEQNLVAKIYSKFISSGSILIKSFNQAGMVQPELMTLEDFEKEKSKIDLLIDKIERDIYVGGKKMTSKEIPSSSATGEILTILLNSMGKSIANYQLPESSYAQDRNEMQSKIISPLVKTIKKYTGKNLPLKITGGLAEFRIKLEPSDLDIRALNKVF
ncbi:MAG: hypothetical protein NT135_01110 [Candidatus Berkelbacteria bacterium]|nr:hypothetical protein [Candidatus Berkelbacteria bacterium]